MDITCPHCGGFFDLDGEVASNPMYGEFFLCLRRAFDTLPEDLRPDFPTMDVFRAQGLIETGWHRGVETFIGHSEAEAQRFATWHVRPDCKVIRKGKVVHIYRPRSQSRDEMNKQEFKQSAHDVLEWASKLIGIDIRELVHEGLSYSIPA